MSWNERWELDWDASKLLWAQKMQLCESTERLCKEKLNRSEASALHSFWETEFLSATLFASLFECFQESRTYERWWYQSLLYSVQKHCESVDEETNFKSL